MKKLFILFAFACFTFSAQAQMPMSLENDTLWITDPDPAIFDTYLENHIINETGNSLALHWSRINNDFCEAPLSSSICIRDLCYPETTSSNNFTLDPNEEAILSAHVFNGMMLDIDGIVNIRVELAADPNTFVIATFIFGDPSCLSVDTDEATAATARFFPNPTSDYFQLEDAAWVEAVSIMDVQGRLVKQFTGAASQYNVSDLQMGSYFAILSDDTGKAVRTIRFEKQ